MIEIIGIEGSREYFAATCVKSALLSLWPDLAETPAEEESVRLAADVKLAGGEVSDIDIVMAGYLRPGRFVHPKKVLRDVNDKRLAGTPVAVENFVVAIEVKDQPAGAVRVTGDKVEVYYSRGASRGWKSATDQNIKQAHAVKNYYADAGQHVFVHRCLVMQGLNSIDADTAVASGFSAAELFTAILAGSPLRPFKGRYSLSSTTRLAASHLPTSKLFRPLVPTSLDRARMDRLSKQGPLVDQLLSAGGKKLTCVRGHGGTGKTITLLQVAWKAYKERSERTLVLTYNHALAADIRRLLALLGVPAGEEGGIMVQTAISFFYAWLYRLGVTGNLDEGYEAYSARMDEALEIIDGGAIGNDDIATIKRSESARFDFDRVLVDEAQDWPMFEVSMLKRLYEPDVIALADGIDQLVRGARADWLGGTTAQSRLLLNLVKCLRMKRNLAIFASALAEDAGMQLDILPSDKAGGGRVILVAGEWAEHRSLHDELGEQALAAGNEPIDSLYCVPSSSIIEVDGRRTSTLSRAFESWGLEVWDGVDEAARHDFPRATAERRVVNYRSCRGLEGWTVVLEHLDQFWTEQFSAKMAEGLAAAEAEGLHAIEELASRQAWMWTFTALTRPIDTLVITLRDTGSVLSKALLRVAEALPDIVENRVA